MAECNINLVFHGVFGLILSPKQIEVVFPFFGLHEYLFGCWDHFEPWGKGSYELVGIDGISGSYPRPDFDPARIPTVYGLHQQTPENLYCGLKLPSYPQSVNFFRDYRHDDKLMPYEGVHGDSLKLNRLAGPVVLSYKAKSPDDLQLKHREKNVKFDRVRESEGGGINLHFFAEGENDLPCECDDDFEFQVGRHYFEVWNRLTGLIGGLDLRLSRIEPFVAGGLSNASVFNTGVPGLPAAQLFDLEDLYKQKHPCPKCDRTGQIGGPLDDCGKAHLIVDNRSPENSRGPSSATDRAA